MIPVTRSMNRRLVFFTSLRLASSLRRHFHAAARSLPRSSFLCPSLRFGSRNLLRTHQQSFSSSSSDPGSIVDAVTSSDWSEELADTLSSSNASWTEELVVYVLRNLENDAGKATNFFRWVSDRDEFKHSDKVYSLLLQVLAIGGSLDRFRLTLKTMREGGFNVDGETHAALLKYFNSVRKAGEAASHVDFYNAQVGEKAEDSSSRSVADVIKGSEWSAEVEDAIGKSLTSPSESSVLAILGELRKDPGKALRFFRWAGERHRGALTGATYNAVARALSKSESTAGFWSMVGEMKTAGHVMDFDTYIKVSKHFLMTEMAEDAVRLYELMMEGPYKPRTRNCVFVLRALTKRPWLDLISRVAKKWEEAGQTLSKEAYDLVHRSLTGAGRTEEARRIMKAMENVGCPPDNTTYRQLVFGLCKETKLQEAFEVLGEMEGSGCAPNTMTWTSLIKGCFEAGDPERALNYFSRMMEKNCEVDAVLLDVMVNGFVGQNKVSGARVLVLEIARRDGVRPLQGTYKTVIEKLVGERKVEEALELLRLMIKHQYPPFPDPFDRYMAKYGSVEDAWEYLRILISKGKASSIPFLRVFNRFFNEGRVSEAKDLLKKCPPNVQQDRGIRQLFKSSSGSSMFS